MKTKHLFKTLAFVLSIMLLVPLTSNIAYAQEINSPVPTIVGESALTMDVDTGEVIYSKNADIKRAIASTTKLLTALIFAEHKSKNDLIPFTEQASKQPDAAINVNYKKMKLGDTLTADDAMEALLIFSANDVAYMMAESVSGSVDKFVDLMNEKVKELGLTNTHFVNPNGLEHGDSYNYSTAYDLAVIAKKAYENEWVRETMSAKKVPDKINVSGSTIILETRNKLLGTKGNVGGKTGMESKAGHCFVGYYDRDGRKIITVVLKSVYGADGLTVFNDTEKIANYSYEAKKDIYKKAGEIVGNVDLNYKVFGFFGPKCTINAPLVLSQDAMYYNNDLNEKNSSIQYLGEDKNAWKLASVKELDLTLNTPDHTEIVKGTVNVSYGQLFKANIAFYLAFVLILAIVAVLVVIILKIIKIKKKRYRGYRRY